MPQPAHTSTITMKTIAIVYDTLDNLEIIIHFLAKRSTDQYLHLVGEACSVNNAYDLLARADPDIALLSTQIYGGTSFDVLARLHNKDQQIPYPIFMTAHGKLEKATSALRYADLDIISNPIDETMLREALNRAVTRLDAQDYMLAEIKALLTQQLPGNTANQVSIELVIGSRLLVAVNELVYFQAIRDVTQVSLANREVLTVAKNINYFTRTLQDNDGFLLVHQNLMINTAFIKGVNAGNGEIRLTTGQQLTTSKRGIALVRNHMARNKAESIPGDSLLTRLINMLNRLTRKR